MLPLNSFTVIIVAHRTPSAEKEIDEDHLVTNSPVDTEKEDLEKRLSELEALYTQSMSDLNILKEQNSQQRELLVLQDKLISQMAIELEETSSTQQQPEPTVDINVLTTTQTHVADMVQELNELRVLKPTFESGLSTLLTQLQADDEKLDHLESIATQVQKTNTAQTEYIDTKVQTLLTQVLHKNEMINKLQQENEQQEKQIQALLLKSNTNSARSSLVSENARNSLRWKGNMLPPASPPPSSPLPPIPTATESSTTRSILSELSKGIQSSSDIVIEDAFDEAAYYKEFTDQLQQRLSTSKEIDELRVWEPSDYDEIQKKINSETWSLDDEQHKNTAFWKGMKKRLIK